MNSPIPNRKKELLSILLKSNEEKQKKKYREAIDVYKRGLDQLGDHVELLRATAGCYYSLAQHNPKESGENYERAILWIERALRITLDDPTLHAELAEYSWLGILDYDRASKAYRDAIEIDPNYVRALVGGAALFGAPARVVTIDEAIGWLERVVILEPDNPDYHARLGQLYFENGRVSESIEAWLRALTCRRELSAGYSQVIRDAGI